PRRCHAQAAAAAPWPPRQGRSRGVVLSPPPRRPRETWHDVALALGVEATGTTVVYDPAVYEAGDGRVLLALVAATAGKVATLGLIGHNPTISMLSALLDPAAGNLGPPPCGIALPRGPGSGRDLTSRAAAPLVATHTARA